VGYKEGEMLGTTLATGNASTWTAVGELPDVTSNLVTLRQVNQDNFGSEYRLGAAHLNYRMLIRNTVESPKKDGTIYNRHNLEASVVPNNPTDVALYGHGVPLIVSLTFRIPSTSTPDGIKLAGALYGGWSAKFMTSSGGFLLPVFNFES
jgi:hypothetical protein